VAGRVAAAERLARVRPNGPNGFTKTLSRSDFANGAPTGERVSTERPSLMPWTTFFRFDIMPTMKAQRDFDAALVGVIQMAVWTARNMCHVGNSAEAYRLLTDICRLPEVVRREEGCISHLETFVQKTAPRYLCGVWVDTDLGTAVAEFMDAYQAYAKASWGAERREREQPPRER